MAAHTPVSMDVLATMLDHQQRALEEMKDFVKEISALVKTLAPADDVKALRQEVSELRAQNASVRSEALAQIAGLQSQLLAEIAKREAQDLRIRALEDARTAAKAIIALAGLIGLGTIGAFLRWLLRAP